MVVVDVDGLSVVFPYPVLYPEQLLYMKELNKALQNGGHALLEMPSGTGKTITLLSLITAFLSNNPQKSMRKLVYCTRTVEEMQKVLHEMKILVAAREQQLNEPNELVTVCLTSRKHLCIHEQVGAMDGPMVDSGCRALTSSWVRDHVSEGHNDVPFCKYFENYDREGVEAVLKPGVYNVADLRAYGRQRQWCPYFLARHCVTLANILVYSYHYLLDPKVAGVVSADLPPHSIIVFDEAHNIDNVCIEALSVDLEQPMLDAAHQNVLQLNSFIYRAKDDAQQRLHKEYTTILSGIPLHQSNINRTQAQTGRLFRSGDQFPAAPVLPSDLLMEAVPETIRKAEQFVELLAKLVSHLRSKAMSQTVSQERPIPFLRQLANACNVKDNRVFRATHDRLISLLLTTQVSSWSDFKPLLAVGDFITLLSTYEREGMAIITEPYNDFTGEYEPVLRLACLDASLAIRWITDRFRNVVITSGTLSPLDTYPRMLNFQVVVSASFNMSMERRCVCPLIITKGSDQVALSSKYNDRQTADIPRNYGDALRKLAECVPDGIVVFFVSYVFMQQILQMWKEDGNLLDELRQLKLLFVETPDAMEASLAIQNYKKACDSGRGAILLSVARGRAAEGIDFDGHYGRAVILFGVPFQYTESRILKARLRFLAERYQIQEDDFLVFDVGFTLLYLYSPLIDIFY